MLMVPFRRKGTAEGYSYAAIVYAADDGWRWVGQECHSDAAGTDLGAVVASGGPFEFDTEAAREAEHWFMGIPKIVETAVVDL